MKEEVCEGPLPEGWEEMTVACQCQCGKWITQYHRVGASGVIRKRAFVRGHQKKHEDAVALLEKTPQAEIALPESCPKCQGSALYKEVISAEGAAIEVGACVNCGYRIYPPMIMENLTRANTPRVPKPRIQQFLRQVVPA